MAKIWVTSGRQASKRTVQQVGGRIKRQIGWLMLINALVLLMVTILAEGAYAAPLNIPPGFDLFQTFGPTTFPVGFPAGAIAIAGTPSDPFGLQVINFIGAPAFLPPPPPRDPILVFTDTRGCHSHSVNGTHCTAQPVSFSVGNPDTIIERLDQVNLNAVGNMGQTRTEIEALALISENPIPLTFGGNQGPNDIFALITLAPDNRPTPAGVLGVLRTGESTVEFTTNIPMPADVRLSLVRAGAIPFTSGTIRGEVTIDPLLTQPTPGGWNATVVPEPSTWLLLGSGLAGLIGRRRLRRKTGPHLQ